MPLTKLNQERINIYSQNIYPREKSWVENVSCMIAVKGIAWTIPLMANTSSRSIITSLLLMKKNALISEIHLLSEMPRTLVRINAVPVNDIFYNQLSVMKTLGDLLSFSSFSLIFSRAPIMTDITVALAFHSLCNCNLKSL